MKYIATVDDQTYEIEINAPDEITLNGQRLSVDFIAVAEQAVYSLILEGRSYEAYVDPTEEGWQVLLRGQLYQVRVEDERQRRLLQATGREIVQTGEFHLKAPMPGLVVDVPVQEGQEVEKGDVLVVLESMKMQNELKAPRPGKVTRVRVRPGDSVEQNALMVILT